MLPRATDDKLITKALNGSQGSWVKIVKRYEGLVYNYCLRMTGNGHDAMDLMQEVFLSVFRNLPSYRGKDRFKPWMMRIATNKTIDFLRGGARAARHDGGGDGMEVIDNSAAPECNNPDFLYERGTENREIMRTLALLPPEQRVVVELKFFQHFTCEEIGYQTGVSINTVKSRLYSALEKLKEHLEAHHVM